MERSRLLLKLADAIEARGEQFARLESLNCGKPYARALGDEIPAIADCFRYFAGAARCVSGTVANEYLAGHTSMIRRDPIGVVGSIAPWNYPLMMAAWKIAPALAAGNTVVIKPSEQTPLTDAAAGAGGGRHLPEGRAQRHRRPRRRAWASRWSSTRRWRMVSLTGDVGHRPQDPAGGHRHAEAHAPGTGRQGAGDRLRRCRHRRGGRGAAHLRLLQRRAGLHGGLPRVCRRQDLRQAGGRPVQRGQDHQGGAAGRRRTPRSAR